MVPPLGTRKASLTLDSSYLIVFFDSEKKNSFGNIHLPVNTKKYKLKVTS